MKCDNCFKYIPKSVSNCPYCNRQHELKTEEYPEYDKYGYPTTRISIDNQKQNARDSYIKSMLKTTKPRNMNLERPCSTIDDFSKCFGLLFIYGSFAAWGIGIAFFPRTLFHPIINSIISLVLYWIVLFLIYVTLDAIKTKKQRKIYEIASQTRIDIDKEYRVKDMYYQSPKVIGFSELHHRTFIDGSVKEFYEYYEIDRKTIKSISYDADNAGYILHTEELVYSDYLKEAKNSFFIADVFDDNNLTLAVGKSLPPKQIYF